MSDYEAPKVTDITPLVPKRRGRWRQEAAVYVAAVIFLSKDTPFVKTGDPQALARLKSSISKAYPFYERAMHPYQMWLREVKEQLADLVAGKPPVEVEDIRYKLIGGKPPQ